MTTDYCIRIRVALLVLPGALLLAGCGEAPVAVTGKVKLEGKLLVTGTVTFENTEKRVIKSAPIGQDGGYAINIVAGACKVTVTVPSAAGMPEGMKMDPSKMGADGKQAEKAAETIEVPSQYTSMQSTPLSFTVQAGQSSIDINMKADVKNEP